MENLGKFTLFIVAIVCGFLVALLGTYVLLSIANLYKLAFVTQFSFVQVYGIICLKGMLFYKHKKDNDNSDKNQSATEKMFTEILVGACFYLLTWGLSFLTYSILT